MSGKDRLTVVVGAGGGIGSSISKHMISLGHSVLLVDSDITLLQNLMNDLPENKQVISEILDITDHDQVLKIFKKYEEHYVIAILINCAGISYDGTSDISFLHFQKMMNVNFWGTYNTICAVLPQMKQENSGTIINIVSQSGKRARPKTGAYAATKFALMGYIEGLQKELANLNIKVSALCPGMVNTRQTDDEPDYDKAQMIQPKDLLCVIDFLLSVPCRASVKEIIFECVQQLNDN